MLNVEQALKKFEKYIQSEGRKILTKEKRNDTKSLYNAKWVTTKKMPNSISIYFDLGTYGAYVDQGVKGKDPSKVSKGAKIKGQQAPNSPYKFNDKAPPTRELLQWIKRKGIQPRFRDEKGKYQKGTQLGFARMVSLNIYHRGLKPSYFFTKPFQKAFERLPEELAEIYGLDAMNLIKNIIRQPK